MKFWHRYFHGELSNLYGWKPILGLPGAESWELITIRCECGKVWEVV